MKIAVCGRAKPCRTPDELRQAGFDEVWTVGVAKENGYDRYYELHGMETTHDESEVVRIPHNPVYQYARENALPINNSISVMLLDAYLSGATKLLVEGCPMCSTYEYREQKPAMAMVIGFLKGKGIETEWSEGPDSTDYGQTADFESALKIT